MNYTAIELYKCECGALHKESEFARRCCTCVIEGCEAKKVGSYIYCKTHLQESQAKRAAERIDKLLAVPVVEPDGWVYVDALDDYFESVDDASVAVVERTDVPVDWDRMLAFPCFSTAPELDLVEYIEESWYESADWDDDGPRLSSELCAKVRELEAEVNRAAPGAHGTSFKTRVILPAYTVCEHCCAILAPGETCEHPWVSK